VTDTEAAMWQKGGGMGGRDGWLGARGMDSRKHHPDTPAVIDL